MVNRGRTLRIAFLVTVLWCGILAFGLQRYNRLMLGEPTRVATEASAHKYIPSTMLVSEGMKLYKAGDCSNTKEPTVVFTVVGKKPNNDVILSCGGKTFAIRESQVIRYMMRNPRYPGGDSERSDVQQQRLDKYRSNG